MKGEVKTKKTMKNSQFAKTMKVPPGDGQKWTTLEHNGVIFPPPYKPHGVKMLYNGKPVDLTPEQEEVGNFRVEAHGLFRRRGEHPKMGKLKRRFMPSDITINIEREAPVPKCPIPGESWKEVKHGNTVCGWPFGTSN